MNNNEGKTEQFWIDGDLLATFKQICNIKEKKPKSVLESLVRAYNIENRSVSERYFGKRKDDPDFVQVRRNAVEMMDEIMAFEPKHNLRVQDAVFDVFKNREVTQRERMSIKRFFSQYGIGFGKYEMVYIAVNNPILASICGSLVYQNELKKHPDYYTAKTCNIAGTPRWCLVFYAYGNGQDEM
jgi:hypothetical protein